jgi:hypothetical protein
VGKAENDVGYRLGDLDLPESTEGIEIDDRPVPPVASTGADEARFYASLPMGTPALPTPGVEDDEELWANLPSLELAHDPRNDTASVPPRLKPTTRPPAGPSSTFPPGEEEGAAEPLESQGLLALPELAAAPNNLLETPRYAIASAIFSVQMLLARRELQGDRRVAEQAFEGALVELGRALVPLREQPELARLKAKFDDVDERRARRSSVEDAVRETKTSLATQEEALDAELAELKLQAEPAQVSLARIESELKQANAHVQRVEGLHKRAEIALRAAKQAVSLPAGTSVGALEQTLEERRRELAEVSAVKAAAESRGTKARNDLDHALEAQRAHGQKRDRLLAEGKKRSDALQKRSALFGQSEAHALRALACAARDLKLAGGARAASDATEKCARTLDALDKELERLALSLSHVDRPLVLRGALLIAAALVALYVLAFG